MSDPTPQVKIFVDGQEVLVKPGTSVIKAAESVGKTIPHFCYHPGLPVVGQCRMCFVEIEGAPKLATACSTPVAEGMKVLTQSDKVKAGQNATLEFTLLQHPLDCPICDRGGECKLQDHTYDYGPPLSRMTDEKIEKDKHRAISDQVVLDQERCILCTRCERFSSHVDGRTELVVENRGSANVINVFENRAMLSKFSGNVVDLCPVGALTARDFRFQARPWELKKFDAICTGCSVGCNISINTKHRHPGIERPDHAPPVPKVLRLMPRENKDINQWWMCDKGRWGYHFHNDESKRLTQPLQRDRREQTFEPSSLRAVQELIDSTSKSSKGSWEFWATDSVPHEGLSWVKELAKSWSSRGRSVSTSLNPSKVGQDFVSWWGTRLAASPWAAGVTDWTEIKTIVSTAASYRDLEDQAPILALRWGQAIREGRLKWVSVGQNEFFKSNFDLASTAFLLPVPTSASEVEKYKAIPAEAKILILWSSCNARGVLNEGICPTEVIGATLANTKAQGPLFLVAQATQNPYPKELIDYVKTAPFVIVADSFESELSKLANIVLPLTPLYEAQITLTSIENHLQKSAGIRLEHPNHDFQERGGPLVGASLRMV